MTENKSRRKDESYEGKMRELEGILEELERGDTPIDGLARDVKRAATLIREMDAKLKSVEKEVLDAFKDIQTPDSPSKPLKEEPWEGEEEEPK